MIHKFLQQQIVILDDKPYVITITTEIHPLEPERVPSYTAVPFGEVWEIQVNGQSITADQGGRLLRHTEEQARTEAYRLNHPEDRVDD